MKIKLSIVSAISVLFYFLFLTGCVSVKPGSVKSGNKLYETFYVGEDGTQYFIKPVVFYNIKNNENIYIDFTFRYKNEIKDSVMVNFSLQSSNIFKRIDSLTISNTSHKIISKNIKLMYTEKGSKSFYSRFATKISLIEFNKMFEKTDWTINVYKDNTDYTYISNKKTKKVLKKLQDKIFILLQ